MKIKKRNKERNIAIGIFLWILYIIILLVILLYPAYLISKMGLDPIYRIIAILVSLLIVIFAIIFISSTKFAKRRWEEVQIEWMKQDKEFSFSRLMIKLFFSLVFLQIFLRFGDDNIFFGLVGLIVGWAVGYWILKIIKK